VLVTPTSNELALDLSAENKKVFFEDGINHTDNYA